MPLVFSATASVGITVAPRVVEGMTIAGSAEVGHDEATMLSAVGSS